jgi:hypothetical protein
LHPVGLTQNFEGTGDIQQQQARGKHNENRYLPRFPTVCELAFPETSDFRGFRTHYGLLVGQGRA